VGDPTHQHHDWEPGIADSGLFWTIPLGNGAIDADPVTGTARFRGQAVKVTDYHDFFNAVLGGGPAPLPARVNYDVRWVPAGTKQSVRDATFGFVGDYVPARATVTFEAADDHGSVVYRSDPSGQTNVGQPAVGTERNGVFFH
jgi:hypothetical protein